LLENPLFFPFCFQLENQIVPYFLKNFMQITLFYFEMNVTIVTR
jgi:hypothetical protein